MSFNKTTEILESIKQGQMVIIMDDEERENEGDLIMAASLVKPEDINFMSKYGRGLICLTLTEERCEKLNLPLMVGVSKANKSTNFTVSIEAKEGVTTGISAHDRSHTIQTAVAKDARADDITQPGHIFPVMSRTGGVLTRAGHTEAGCDLARLSGLEPAAVIVEILSEDGTMARRHELEKISKTHNLLIGTIEDLIRYRIKNEKSVIKLSENEFETDFGKFLLVTYRDTITNCTHLALVKGDVSKPGSILVRVHVQNTLSDVLLGTDTRLGWPLRDALKRINDEGRGVAVILRWPENEDELNKTIDMFNNNQIVTNNDMSEERRTVGIGAQILADLGVHEMRLLSAPQVLHGLGGFGLKVTEYISD